MAALFPLIFVLLFGSYVSDRNTQANVPHQTYQAANNDVSETEASIDTDGLVHLTSSVTDPFTVSNAITIVITAATNYKLPTDSSTVTLKYTKAEDDSEDTITGTLDDAATPPTITFTLAANTVKGGSTIVLSGTGEAVIDPATPSNFIVGKEEGTDTTCLTQQSACTSIASVLSNAKFKAGDSITLQSGVETAAFSCTITQSVSITSYSSTSCYLYASEMSGTAIVTVSPTAATSANVMATFESLNFYLYFESSMKCNLFKVERKTTTQNQNTGGAGLVLDDVKISRNGGDSLITTNLIEASAGHLYLTDVRISDLSLSKTPLLHVDLQTTGAFTMTRVDFSYIKRRGNDVGSVLDEDLTSKDKSLDLSGATFSNCGASADEDSDEDTLIGSGLRLKLKKEDGGSLTLPASCFPYSSSSKRKANAIFEVDNVAILKKTGTYDIETTFFSSSLSSDDEHKFYVKVDSAALAPFVTLLGPPTDTFYITTSTSSSDNCGWESLPCGKFADHVKASGSYILSEGTHTGAGKTLTVSSSLSIEGTAEEDKQNDELVLKTTLSVTKSDKFEVKEVDGELELDGMMIVGSGESRTVSFIEASAGSLILNYIHFTSITLATTPLITLTSECETEFDKLLFKDITRSGLPEGAKTGGGAVFEIAWISDEKGIRLSEMEFDNCKCTTGNGGALYLGFTAVPVDSTLQLYALTFTNIASDAAKYGNCIFFDCSTLKLEDVQEYLEEAMEFSPQKDKNFMFQTSDEKIKDQPQNVYSLVEDDVLVVDSTDAAASSANTCGSYATPCASIAAALASTKYSAKDDDEKYKLEDISLLSGTHKAEAAVSTISGRDMGISGGTSNAEDTTLTIASISGASSVFVLTSEKDVSVSVGFLYITFTATESSSTGLVSVSSDKVELVLHSVAFTNAQSTITYSTPLIDASKGKLLLSAVSFSTITMEDTPLMHINTKSGCFEMTTVEYQKNTFSNIIRKTGNGAVLEETLTADSSVSIAYSSFTNCKSTNGVGVMYFTVPDATPSKVLLSIDRTVSFKHMAYYEYENKYQESSYYSSIDPTICAVGLKAKSLSNIGSTEPVVFSASDYTSYDSEYKYYATATVSSSTLTAALRHFFEAPTSQKYISTSTFKETYCGWKDLPCGLYKDHVKGAGEYHLLEGTHASSAAALTLSDNLYIYGSSDDESDDPTLTVTKGDTFTVGTHTLSLQSLIITRASSFEPLEASLITAESGSVYLDTVHFKSIDLKGVCLINSFSSLSLSRVVFDTITRSDEGTEKTGGASVFILTVEAGGSIPLSGASFVSCSGAAKGLGGAVYITLTGVPSSVSFDRTPFSGDASSLKPAKGKYIYFDASAAAVKDFAKDFATELKGLVKDETKDVFTYYKGTDDEKDLYEVLGMKKQALEVKKGESLKTALDTIESDGLGTGNTVTIAADVELSGSEPLEIKKGVEIKGSSTTLTVTDVSETVISVEGQVDVSISSINTKITASSADDAISKHIIELEDNPTVTLTDVSFSSDTASSNTNDQTPCYVSTSLIDASEGTLILSRVSFSYITITSSSSTSLIDINTAPGAFKVTSSLVFTDITSTRGSGTAFNIKAEKGAEVVIEHTTFTRCKTPKGNGGAICASLSAASFTLNDCTFEGCQAGESQTTSNAASEYGYGGAMFITASKEPTIVLSNLKTKGCTAAAENGGNVMLLVYHVEAGEEVPEAFWQKLMAGVSGAGENDYIAVTVDSSDKYSDPIKLSKYQHVSDDDDDSFPTWAIVLIVVLSVLVVAAVVAGILIYFFVIRKRSKVDVTDDKPAEEMAPASPEESN